MRELRANTEVIVTVGPFVDVGDGFTPQTDIALSGNEAELIKHGATAVVDISGSTWAAVTNCRGHYSLTLDATDTNTPGNLRVVVQDDSDCLPVCHDYVVLGEFEWDRKYLYEGKLSGALSGVLDWGTGQANSDVDVITFEAGHEMLAGHGGHIAVSVFDGAGQGATKLIQSVSGDDGVPDGSFATAPTTTSKYIAFPVPSSSVDNAPLVDSDLFQKNTEFANFVFAMRDEDDHATLISGRTVTATRSINGAAYAACANSVSEIGSSGTYKITLAAADLNGDVIALLFSATGADTVTFTIKTQDV